jgi:altronate hydrolase
MAISPVGEGQPVRKYGQTIGFASKPIAPGDWVHEHNVALRDFARDYRFAEGAKNDEILPPELRATFEGYQRPNGKVGTRNYIGILTSVNCSASVAKFIAEEVNRSGILDDHPEIDGAVAFVHGSGCGMAAYGEGWELLRRTQWGYATHPNLGAALMVGLGCEVFQIDRMKDEYGMVEGDHFQTMTIQATGGTRKTVDQGIARIKAMLPVAARAKRETRPASEIVLALQCGGSDGYSGITANPSLGAAVDLLVKHGGTAVLAETPEIYGAEHLLTRRAINRAVGEKLVERIRWWEDYTKRNGGEMNNNPAPGNKAGGLTTILEKSLGGRSQRRHDDLARGLRIRRTGQGKRLRFHGHARLRPGWRDRTGGRRLQRDVLHHRPRIRVRLQANAVDQTRHQYRDVPSHDRRHGHQLRRCTRWNVDRSQGPGNFRKDAASRLGHAYEIRGAGLWRT